MAFQTPILFLIFNRPDTTKQVFAKIREVKPKYLYVAADGPRSHKEGEKELCEQTRKIVTDNIDWDCELVTLFREENLGCGKAVSGAITWFFENVEQGIILEDDTLPDISFFKFCEELLIKYRDNHKIMSIGGVNFLSSIYNSNVSYLFSEYGGIWGWASWSRAWEGYDFEITAWSNTSTKLYFNEKYPKEFANFFEQVFNSVKAIDTWDYQWWFHRLINNGMDITPSVNLVRNIGFDSNATHTYNTLDEIKNLQTEAILFPLKHPNNIEVDLKYDNLLAKKYYSKKVFKKQNLLRRVLNKLKLKFT